MDSMVPKTIEGQELIRRIRNFVDNSDGRANDFRHEIHSKETTIKSLEAEIVRLKATANHAAARQLLGSSNPWQA